MTLRRWVFLSGVAVLCAWVLVPIWLIAASALGGQAQISAWPKPFWPVGGTLDGLAKFLAIEGVWKATLNSVQVAAMTMVMAILLGAPAGYALARFSFGGATLFRVLVMMTRAFPVAILALPLTVSFIRMGVYDTPFGVALMHTTLAPALRHPRLRQPVPGDPA